MEPTPRTLHEPPETEPHGRRGAGAESAAHDLFDRPAPADYLEEWARRLAQPEEQGEKDRTGVLVFRLHKEWLALPTAALVEVTDPHPVHAVPHRTGPALLGLVNIRGQLRLCVSLHGLLGVGPPRGEATAAAERMIIARDRNEHWVFAAQEVAGIRHLAAGQLRPVPSTFTREASHARAVFEHRGHTVGLLDEGRLFDSLRSLGQ